MKRHELKIGMFLVLFIAVTISFVFAINIDGENYSDISHYHNTDAEESFVEDGTFVDSGIYLTETRTCPVCKGDGKCIKCRGTGKCDRCGGSGYVGSGKGRSKCRACYLHAGSGKCTNCDGRGKCQNCSGRGTYTTRG